MTEDHISSTHPQLPPTTEEHRCAWLRLLRSRRVGIATFYRLMAQYGSAEAALEALPDIARDAGETNYSLCPVGVVAAEMKAAAAAGAQMVTVADRQYPANLKTIPDAPPILWALGDLGLLNRPLVALVGARNASSLGTRMARSLAKNLGDAGFTIVSGLARGIDTAAHHAALETGTIAIFAGGVDVTYPAENADLSKQMATHGLRLSEQPMGTVPQARHFPARNRIISGIATAVVVVEAAAKSGSLITARNALDQGRDVLAVPGHPFDARASGCNMLIRDGATLVRSADDILEAINISPKFAKTAQLDLPMPQAATPKRSLSDTASLHMEILNRLGPSPVAENQLIRDLGTSAQSVSNVLVDLEIDGRIQRQSGGLVSRT